MIVFGLNVLDAYQKAKAIKNAATHAIEGVKKFRNSSLNLSEKIDVVTQTGFALLQTADLGNTLGVTPAFLSNNTVTLNLATGAADAAQLVTHKIASGQGWKRDDTMELAAKATGRASETLSLAAKASQIHRAQLQTGARVFATCNNVISNKDMITKAFRTVTSTHSQPTVNLPRTYTQVVGRFTPDADFSTFTLSPIFSTFTPAAFNDDSNANRLPTEQEAKLVDDMAKMIVNEANLSQVDPDDLAEEIYAFVRNPYKKKLPTFLPNDLKQKLSSPGHFTELELCVRAIKTIWESINFDENLPDTSNDPLVPKFNWEDLERNPELRDLVWKSRTYMLLNKMDLNAPLKRVTTFQSMLIPLHATKSTHKSATKKPLQTFLPTMLIPLHATKSTHKSATKKPLDTFLPKDKAISESKANITDDEIDAFIDTFLSKDGAISESEANITDDAIDAFKKNPLKVAIPSFIPTFVAIVGKRKIKIPLMPPLHDSMDTQVKKLIDDLDSLRLWICSPQKTQPPFDIQEITNKVLEYWSKNI